MPSRLDLINQAQALYPFLTYELAKHYVEFWIDTGDPNLAMAMLRQSPVYDNLFPGIKREDGTLRMAELEYLATMDAYRNEFSQYGLPRDMFDNRLVELISGDVAPNELRTRLATVYTQIAQNTSFVRQAYAQQFGLDPNSLSISSIFASAIDGNTDPVVFESLIRRAQISGEALSFNFDLPLAEVTRLAEFGFTQEAARSFYSQAQSLLPRLGDLVARHLDPDDTFSLEELSDALIFTDPDQQERISRLFAQEASLFSPNALFATRSGTLPGLAQR